MASLVHLIHVVVDFATERKHIPSIYHVRLWQHAWVENFIAVSSQPKKLFPNMSEHISMYLLLVCVPHIQHLLCLGKYNIWYLVEHLELGKI